MSRKDLTNREPVNCAIRKELNQALIELSKKTKIPKSKLLDNAVELFLSTVQNESKQKESQY